MWHRVIVGRGAYPITTCLFKSVMTTSYFFIIKIITLRPGTCGGQKTVSSQNVYISFTIFGMYKSLVSYLVTTHNKCDKRYSISKRRKYHASIDPRLEWVQLIRKIPLKIHVMVREDFYVFRLVKNLRSKYT
jgi:hypothetical protein